MYIINILSALEKPLQNWGKIHYAYFKMAYNRVYENTFDN